MALIVNDTTPRHQYTAAASQTTFTYSFAIFADADLKVYVGSTLKTLATDYTVTGAGTTSGGTVVFNTGLNAGDIVTIYRDLAVARTTDFQTAGDFKATVVNDELDKMTMMIQQNEHNTGLALRADQFDETANLTIPNKATRANNYLKFDTNGAPVTVTEDQLFADLAGAVIRANYITDNATGDGTTVNFTLSSDPAAKSNLQIYIDGVYQNKATFSLTGTTVIFTEAPPLNASVEFIIGYSIGSISDAAMYSDTTANFTGTLQNGGSNVVVDSDIGSTVQAYDANILTSSDIGSTVQAYDANILTSSDIGSTVQAYDATILKSADIGSTIQAYDADTAKTDVAQTFTAEQTFNENIVIGTSGKGIDFSDTANGSGTTTSELFDDYEEGTFTGVFTDLTTDYTMNASYTTGSYVKIGQLVTISGAFIGSSANGMGGSNLIYLKGLPYNVGNSNKYLGGVGVGYYAGLNLPAAYAISAATQKNTDTIRFFVSDRTTSMSGLQQAELTDTGLLYFSLSYMTD